MNIDGGKAISMLHFTQHIPMKIIQFFTTQCYERIVSFRCAFTSGSETVRLSIFAAHESGEPKIKIIDIGLFKQVFRALLI